jgi:hypothetical protein
LIEMEKDGQGSNKSRNFEVKIRPRRSILVHNTRGAVHVTDDGEYLSKWIGIINKCLETDDLFKDEIGSEQSFHTPTLSVLTVRSDGYPSSRLFLPRIV